jgi:hypothetical protein
MFCKIHFSSQIVCPELAPYHNVYKDVLICLSAPTYQFDDFFYDNTNATTRHPNCVL